jgi:hypothetical protein
MGTWIEGRTHFFVCDICNDNRTTLKEPLNVSFDEWRSMRVGLTEAGWRITKREVLCPDCAQFDGYKMGPDALDDL